MKISQLHEGTWSLYAKLRKRMRKKYNRHVSFGDLMTDRWETAKHYGFGEGASCYDNVLILGDVKVGEHTWIGPNVILDGVGGLEIGSYCTICAGVQIYSHDTVKWAVSMGKEDREVAPTQIGSGVFIGPQCVIQKGVHIGDRVVIGAMSLVTTDIPSESRAWGAPAKVQGR
jgi:acetyltransferase-like isoleucine patch superfamily enzyme